MVIYMLSGQISNDRELLNDIRHVNQVTKEEIKRSGDHIRQLVYESSMPTEQANDLISEISVELGQLSAKIYLADKAILALQAKQKAKAKPAALRSQVERRTLSLKFEAHQMTDNRNLLPMERSPDGINYCWTGANSETSFSFDLDRKEPIGMNVRVFAFIKPEYSKELSFLIDGQHIKHFFSLSGTSFVLSCVLPPSSSTKKTDVKIVLPDTHSPTDLGGDLDDRKLGIAIIDFSFGEPESGFSRLLKRLKLR